MINSVRNTVIAILNKNNYGYISPSDFNLYAQQAQLELFMKYFSDYNAIINKENARGSGTDYADFGKSFAEQMEEFIVTNSLTNTSVTTTLSNTYYLPSLITTGDEEYMINKVLCYSKILASGVNTSFVVSQLIDSSANFSLAGVSVGDIVTNTSVAAPMLTATVTSVSATALGLSANIFTLVPESYRIVDASVQNEAEKVSAGKITLLNMSPITSPSVNYPAYTQTSDSITFYPSSIINLPLQVEATYFRYPKVPKWTFTSLANGEPVFNQSQPDYQDFEIGEQNETSLVVKILQYCGISIRETLVAQFGKQEEMENNAQIP
jgi:hypothetical protein